MWSVTDSPLDDAIQEAKSAAQKAGFDTETFAAVQSKEGRTSFAFELEGLGSASSVSELEEAIEQIEGVDAKIVYPSAMAWISASRTLDPTLIVDAFQQHGVTATLTDSSLRRRLAWTDVEEGRYRRARARRFG